MLDFDIPWFVVTNPRIAISIFLRQLYPQDSAVSMEIKVKVLKIKQKCFIA